MVNPYATLRSEHDSTFTERMFGRNPELIRRRAEAEKTQRKEGKEFPLLHDPIEDDETTGRIIKEVREQISSRLEKPIRGQCHIVWKETQRILKEDHQIEWFSPREMNPKVKFD